MAEESCLPLGILPGLPAQQRRVELEGSRSQHLFPQPQIPTGCVIVIWRSLEEHVKGSLR